MPKRKRLIEYDLMRIIACLCVIMIHTAVFNQADQFPYTSLQFQAVNIWGVLSRWAVPAFVMLSGMLILPRADEESILRLFKHRVLRMVGAYFAWSCVYSAFNVYALDIVYSETKFKTFIDGCFSGEIHMWYLLMLAGLYISSPLIAALIKNLSRKWTLYWLTTLFVFSSCIPLLVKLNIKFLSVILDSVNGYMNLQFLGGWTFYFVLGYYFQKHDFTKKEKMVIWLFSLISLLFTLYGTVIYYINHGKAMGILPYEYPNIVFMSVGVLLLFKETSNCVQLVKHELIIRGLSDLTFGIYLIHVLVLKMLFFAGINIQMFHPIISIPILAMIVFICSGCIIWVIRRIPYIGVLFA